MVAGKVKLTSDSGISGGPEAISAALVPGRILREALWSREALSAFCWTALPPDPGDGDRGPICTSGNGGGLGRRGELAGETCPWRDGDVIVVLSRRLKYTPLEERFVYPGQPLYSRVSLFNIEVALD